ncbi:S-adenosyl-L-methionine-dependent methyltransferase [Nemania sp. FL0031]|nr:S-adenosyl-L-methionine-dependent methyltransferase [Nemania sp. FL0031]
MRAQSPTPASALHAAIDLDTWIADVTDEIPLSIQDLEAEGLTAFDLGEPDLQIDDVVVKVEEDHEHKLGNIVVDLPFSTLAQPASHFGGFVAPAPEDSERHAVATLLESLDTDGTDDYIEFDLDHFSIYINTNLFSNELRPLQHLKSRAVTHMYFDGVLQHGDRKFYVRKVPFAKLPVGNYGESEHTVGDQIWILSALNEKLGREIYYKLRSPAPEYRRFHTPFLWIADFAKHVIDYCEYRQDKDERAAIRDFESRFSDWLLYKHKYSAVFQKWYAASGSTDFRAALPANIDYIFEEANSLNRETISRHDIWREVKMLNHYPLNLVPSGQSTKEISKTIVTPYIHDLFSHMVFGKHLEGKEASMSVETRRNEFDRKRRSTVSQPSSFRSKNHYKGRFRSIDQKSLVASIEPGDVISTLPDSDATTNTGWKRRLSEHYQGEYHWFGLVKKVHQKAHGKRSFDVLWLYQPIDTPCSVMKYPWANELFLSDNCTCHPSISKVQGHEVLATHEVEWFGGPSTTAEFFVRQTYVASDCRWASLRREHLICGDETVFSQEPIPSDRYRLGDAVLVETQTMQLEPYIIEGFFGEEKRCARMRRLWRKKDVDKAAPPNELIYSQQLVDINVNKINRRCLIRAFRVDETIPAPYNRNGTGDAFFITHEEVEAEGVTKYHPLESSHLLFRQGFDPFAEVEKLQGLDLFCGGGNFGRGLEEGGAIDMKWANDIWEGALHTYMANTDPSYCMPFLGSVDDLLRLALAGDQKGTPEPGDVHFISAGSPCPGFSMLTPDRTTPHQEKNQSLVASFASFVDLYRPFYGLLENVPSMVNTGNHRDSCVFSQLVCALVGLEYQVQVLFLDAWSFGSAQKRSRVFLAFTAPGLQTLKAPNASHSHPPNTRLYTLGMMSCGRPFDSRKQVPTPFKFVSMRDAVGDLPDIQDGKADYCIGYPDHRLSMGYTTALRKQFQHIPTHPYGMTFSKAWAERKEGPDSQRVMTNVERSLFPVDGKTRVGQNSKGWGRVNPNGLIGTIATKCMPTDTRIGQVNHWEQSRPTSILEARRAQGFPDSEVIVGTRANQYRVIGNSVSRHVALVLGLAIREAWMGTLLDMDTKPGVPIDLLRRQNDTSPDGTSRDSSEDPLAIFSPCSPGGSTPATNESVEPLDGEMHRKRSLPVYVEVLAKRRRHDLKPEEFSRVQ